MNIDYTIVGRRIRQLRLQKRITQEELAFRIGTSAAYISNIECGKKKPSLQKLAQISEVLEVTINDFIYPSDTISVPMPCDLSEIDTYSASEKQQLIAKNLSALIKSFIT